MKIKKTIRKKYSVILNDGEYQVIKEDEEIQIFKKINQDDFFKKLRKYGEIKLEEQKELQDKFKNSDGTLTSARPEEECIVPTKELIEIYATFKVALPSDIYCKDTILKDSQ